MKPARFTTTFLNKKNCRVVAHSGWTIDDLALEFEHEFELTKGKLRCVGADELRYFLHSYCKSLHSCLPKKLKNLICVIKFTWI